MNKDRLFLLSHEFADPAFGGDRIFYCKDCMTLEGLLAAFPDRTAKLVVIRVAWPRPRALIVDLLGEENQNLPALVMTDGSFVNDIEGVLAALSRRHGFPERHP